LSITTDTELRLEEAESELVAREASAFARALPDPAARARYEALAADAAAGAVRVELVGALAAMLELLFDTGRVSNRAALQSVFARTPRGQAQAAQVREVNRALEALRGQTLLQAHVTSTGPARHSIAVETDHCRVALEITRDGVSVSSLELG
jgi:hypothetical protein